MNGLVRDIRFALKSLRRSPGFTFIAVVTLGLGIGANPAMFSILNAYILRPAPYADRAQIDRIYRVTAADQWGSLSPADYLELRAESGGYGQVAAYDGLDMSVSESGRSPEMANGLRASVNLFDVLGVKPTLGRTFRPEEETAGNNRVVVLSHRYWQNHFAGDANIVGRTIRVDGEPHVVIG